jgi:hypothetical protein
MQSNMFSQRGTALAAMVAAMGNLGLAAKGVTDFIRPVQTNFSRKTFGVRYSGPGGMMHKTLPNGKKVFTPEPPTPEYVGDRMFAKAPSRIQRLRMNRLRRDSKTFKGTEANRILAAEAKRARKADRNLTLAYRGAFNSGSAHA